MTNANKSNPALEFLDNPISVNSGFLKVARKMSDFYWEVQLHCAENKLNAPDAATEAFRLAHVQCREIMNVQLGDLQRTDKTKLIFSKLAEAEQVLKAAAVPYVKTVIENYADNRALCENGRNLLSEFETPAPRELSDFKRWPSGLAMGY